MSDDTLMSAQTSLEELPDFYATWRNKVHKWIASHSKGELADAVLFVPDLLALVIRLMRHETTPMFFKSQMLLVIGYVLLPVDFIPEAVFGAAGLADDAVVMSVLLLRLLDSAGGLDAKLMRNLWAGNGDIVETLRQIVDSGGEVANTKVWRDVRKLFGKKSPDPAVVEQEPKQ